MKTKSYLLLVLISLLTFSCEDKGTKTATFKVWGNCDMCKETIEGSLKGQPGIKKADWNVKSKTMVVSYDTTATNEQQIHKTIAAAGYDTEKEKGSDQAYNSLHDCCKYKRKE